MNYNISFRWHQDITPLNILVRSNGTDSGESPFKCRFKLADFGISHFKSRAASPRQATDLDTSGTLTYGKFLLPRLLFDWDNMQMHF